MKPRDMKLIDLLRKVKAHPVWAVGQIRRLEGKLERVEKAIGENWNDHLQG